MERVQHATFGKGTVVARANGKLTIDFDSGTTKILLERAVAAVEGESKASIAKARRDAKTIRHRAAEATAERERAHVEREWLLRIAARDAEYEGRRAAGSVASTGDPRLDAVLARPDSEVARAAYRDRLLADGDPRAEVMTLGPLSAEQRQRIAELERKHGAAWVAPLAGLEEIRFARGFLDRARVSYRLLEHPELFEHPLWSTATELVSHSPDAAAELFTHPGLRSLRAASLSPAALSAIAARAEPAPLEAALGRSFGWAVTWDGDPAGLPFPRGVQVDVPASWSGALGVGALVNVRALEIALCPDDDSPVAFGQSRGPYRMAFADTDPARVQWLVDSPLGAQLEELDVTIGSSITSELALASWVDALRRHRRLRRVMVRIAYESCVRIEHVPDGVMGSHRSDRGVIAFVLDRLDDEVLVRIQTDAELVNGLLILDRIRGCLAGFPMRAAPAATLQHFYPRPGSEPWLEPIRAGLEASFASVTLERGEIAMIAARRR